MSLLLPTYRELFYLQLRADMKCGDLPVPDSKVGLMGALLAQSEMGNPPEAPIPPLIYPPYFAKWEQGYPWKIALEHKKLKGNEVCALFVFILYAWCMCASNICLDILRSACLMWAGFL